MPFRKYKASEVNIVSAKAFEVLSKSDDLKPVNETAHSPIQRDDEKDRKKHLRGTLIKFGSLAVFAFIVWVFATAAWFSSNSDVSGSGMGVSISADKFEITMLSGSRDGIFNDIYTNNGVGDGNALVWKMTADNNLENYNEPQYNENNVLTSAGDLGLHPGTEGVISFYVTPKVDSVNLDFDFEILGYQASYNDVNNTPDNKNDDVLVLTALSDLPNGDGTSPMNLLNGHILLFEKRTTISASGVTPVVYSYSDPILSDEDMHRIMHRTISGRSTQNQVNIYWVWPNTLSTLIDARSFTGITTAPFCSGTSYNAINANFRAYPLYYLRNYNGSSTISDSDYNDIIAHYDIYGDMYDQGDNELGMSVSYLLIKLSVTEGTAAGGGP